MIVKPPNLFQRFIFWLTQALGQNPSGESISQETFLRARAQAQQDRMDTNASVDVNGIDENKRDLDILFSDGTWRSHDDFNVEIKIDRSLNIYFKERGKWVHRDDVIGVNVMLCPD